MAKEVSMLPPEGRPPQPPGPPTPCRPPLPKVLRRGRPAATEGSPLLKARRRWRPVCEWRKKEGSGGKGLWAMSEGPRRSSDRYPGASGRCQKGPAVTVTDIQGVLDDVRGSAGE
eukprot:gene15048-biopygen11192